MVKMDFKALFYNQSHDRESLIKGLDSLLQTESHIITIIPYASERSPVECFKAFDSNRTFSCISNERGVTVLDLLFSSPREESDLPAVAGRFFVYEHQELPNTYILLTVEPQEFIRRALSPFIWRSYPRIYLTLISQNRLSLLLHDFKEKCGFTDLRVRRASLRSRFTGEKPRQEAIIPSESWPNLGLDGAFDFAQEQNGWFKSLTFEAWKNSRIDAEITVTRNGVMKTDRQFLKVFDGLISPICQIVHNNHDMFRKRSRRDSVSLEVRPLTINFGRDQLADEEERAKLVEAMRLLDKASMSVVHSNPYLQLSVIDYSDGSTFDLWVLNPRELIIVPQLKGTIPAIRRLVSHVFDNYAEGYIEDFQAVI